MLYALPFKNVPLASGVTCATSLRADRSKWHNVECQARLSTKHWNQINHLAWSAVGAEPDQANNTLFSPLSLLFAGPLSLSGWGINLWDPILPANVEDIFTREAEKWGKVLAWRWMTASLLVHFQEIKIPGISQETTYVIYGS